MFQFNLGWKLSLVYKGYASVALLDTYQEERLPIIAEMLGKTTELFNKSMERNGDTTVSLSKFEMTQLGVNYRGSSIIGEDDIRGTTTTVKVSGYNRDSETAACPGDRAPQVPSLINATGVHKRETVTLFDIFSASHHSVLVFAKKYEENSALALSSVIKRLPENTVRSVLILLSESNVNEQSVVYNEVFIDSGGHGPSTYGLPSDQSYFVVVRPDGVVGARVHEVAGVERYFQKIFS
jgi:FAD binding domain